jgi:hypothetical protein
MNDDEVNDLRARIQADADQHIAGTISPNTIEPIAELGAAVVGLMDVLRGNGVSPGGALALVLGVVGQAAALAITEGSEGGS